MGNGRIVGLGWRAAAACWLLGTAGALEPGSPPVRVASRELPVQVETRDAAQAISLLELVEHVVRFLEQRMAWPEAGEVRLLVRAVQPAPPQALDVPPDHFPRRLELGTQTRLVVEMDAGWTSYREAVVRTLVMGLCQAMVWGGQDRVVPGQLPDPPLWLSEGLVQILMNEEAAATEELAWIQEQSSVHRGGMRAEQWRQVVYRAKLRNKTPGLEEIQQWHGLGPTTMERLWRQAFCYWLLACATESPSERQALRQWWQRQNVIVPEPYWGQESGGRAWWARVMAEADKARTYYWDWDQTISHLREALHFEAALQDRSQPVMFTVFAMPREPVRWSNPVVLNEVRRELLWVGARAHPMLQEVVMGYIQALQDWEEGRYEQYLRRILDLVEEQKQWDAYRRAVVDRLIWVEVNRDFSGRGPLLADIAEAVRGVEAEEQELRRTDGGTGP